MQPITESIVNNKEGVRDEVSSSSVDSSAVEHRPAVKLPKLEIVKFRRCLYEMEKLYR